MLFLNEVYLLSNSMIINVLSIIFIIKITGPGLTKYLGTAGNILVLVDEIDGDHQKLGLFGTEPKSNNTK